MEFNIAYTVHTTVYANIDVDEEAYRDLYIEEFVDEDEDFDQDEFEAWLEELVRDEMGYCCRSQEYADGTIGFEVDSPDYMTAEVGHVECGEPYID